MNIYESEHIYLKKASMDDTAAMYQNVWSDRDIVNGKSHVPRTVTTLLR